MAAIPPIKVPVELELIVHTVDEEAPPCAITGCTSSSPTRLVAVDQHPRDGNGGLTFLELGFDGGYPCSEDAVILVGLCKHHAANIQAAVDHLRHELNEGE